jgi:hypothetical protein
MNPSKHRSDRPRPRVGDTIWVAEWIVKLAYYEPGDPESGVDWDNCTSRRRRADTREAARAIAREVLPGVPDTLGHPTPAVEIYPMTFVPYDDEDAEAHPHIGFWEVTADVEYYDGEDETPREGG